MKRKLAPAVLWLAACVADGWCADVAPHNQWAKVDEGRTADRLGSALLSAPERRQMLLLAATEGGPRVQALDLATRTWHDLAAAGLPDKTGQSGKKAIYPYYQAAYDPGSQTIYCLSGGPVLYSFHVARRTWKAHPPAPALEGLSWHTMACDTIGRRLVVVGADKRADNLGWSRTVVYDIPSGTWRRLDVPDEKIVAEHRRWVSAKESLIDLVGQLRLAWYRDPAGTGSQAERAAIGRRLGALRQTPPLAGFAEDLAAVAARVGQGQTLAALRAARSLQAKVEACAEQQYPVPCSRRNSPLVFDERNHVGVLFGGDHEDYLMNDTWLLDLARGTWRRARPERAPSPRAGHALCALPRSGRIAMWEGYVQSSSTDYGAGPCTPLAPRQLWLYDVQADRWDLAGEWPLSDRADRADRGGPPPQGIFEGYAAERFVPPELAADADDRLVLATHPCASRYNPSQRPCQTWLLALDPARLDAGGRAKLGTAPDQRLYRSGAFRAAFCEVPDPPQPTALDRLPVNRWVRLPAPPRNPCQGCRQRDWGTCTWDSDRQQVLHWGGGHCVRSASTVVHWSPDSGRIVEGFDADEPYGGNGGGGFDSSLLNRPWVSVHNYHHYAYDPRCKLLVSARGYLYDPQRMDWLRIEPLPLPFSFGWSHTVVQTSPHGAVAWARQTSGEQSGLWLFDRARGWIDLAPRGRVPEPYCDAHGMVYDAQRDRMILGGIGGRYEHPSDGSFLAFDFQSKALSPVVPANRDLGRVRNAREMVYLDHADWLILGELYPGGEQPVARPYTRVYDCARNKMFLLAAGEVPFGHSTGWMYDARRKLVYVFTYRGEAWTLKIDPATATLAEKP